METMATLDELIKALSGPEVRLRNCRARATKTCKLCEGSADWFRDAVSEFEYRISAICQQCQDKFFHSGDDPFK